MKRYRLPRISVCLFLFFMAFPISSSVAQEGSPGIVQDNTVNDKFYTGQLRSGEVLITALKRERIDGHSITEATKNLNEIFDLRHSRAGDKYEYQITAGRKLTILRYHRAKHVYETKLVNNAYETRLLKNEDTTPQERTVIQTGNTDWQEVDAPMPPTLSRNDLDVDRDEPERTTPEDLVLAAKPSPDAEFPDKDLEEIRSIPKLETEPTEEDEETPGPPLPEEDIQFRAGSDLNDPSLGNIHNNNAPAVNNIAQTDIEPRFQQERHSYPNTPRLQPASAHVAKQAPAVMPTSYKAIFAIGLLMMLAAIAIVAIPQIRLNSRLKKQNMILKELFSFNRTQKLALVEFENTPYLIGVTEDAMFPLACDSYTSAKDKLKAIKKQTYWQNMAGKPLTDEQMQTLLTKTENQHFDEDELHSLIDLPGENPAVRQDDDDSFHSLHMD